MKRREQPFIAGQVGPERRTSSGVRRIDPAVEALRAQPQPAGLVVCERGLWFRTPEGELVSVERWRPLQRLLARLAEHRVVSPGDALSVESLVEAGWPGERMLTKAGATRVYSAIASLRRLGLRDALVRDGRGYLLDPSIAVSRVPSP